MLGLEVRNGLGRMEGFGEREHWAGVQGVPPGPCLECAGRSVWVERLYVA